MPDLPNRRPIAWEELAVRACGVWDLQWFLLTSGDFAAGDYNTMTVSWGSLGVIWNRPFAHVFVRPTRHTHGFMERHDSFTLCTFAEEHRGALDLLGSRSGRDGDKIAASGLTPVASTVVAAPGFAEAELILECRKIYWDDLRPAQFLDPAIGRNYPAKDYHRIYFGEIVAIRGTDAYGTAEG